MSKTLCGNIRQQDGKFFADLPGGIGWQCRNEYSVLNRINTPRPVLVPKLSGIVGNAPHIAEFLEAGLCRHAALIIVLIEAEGHFNKVDPDAPQIPLSRGTYIRNRCRTLLHGFCVFSRTWNSMM